MPRKDYTSAVQAIKKFNYTELKRTSQLVLSRMSEDELGQVIAEKESAIESCPHCGSEYLIKWGASKQGKQRFKCKACTLTFTALTGTPLHKMRKPQLMMAYGDFMFFSHSLRYCAKALSINLKTAFHWRHKLLSNPQKNKPVELLSIVEADETFVAESNKGSRSLNGKARKRGGGKHRKVPILIALDRQGAITHTVMNKNTKQEITNALAPVLSPDSILCTDGNLSYIEVVKSLTFTIEHKRLIAEPNKKAKIEGVYSIQRLNNYIMRWKIFMKPFKGVATHYLDRYLSWFRYLQKDSIPDLMWIIEGATRPPIPLV